MLRTLPQDIQYSFRMLVKRPGFTVVAVITLALGIGANTAIFSVVNTVLLRPLAYKDPARLVAIESINPSSGKGQTSGVSPADFWDWQQQSQSFENLATYSGTGVSFPTEPPESVPATRVTINFFETLGVDPLLGRSFVAEEQYQNGPRAIMLSHKLWQRRFSGDPAIVGQTIRADDGAMTVIGVMPPDFKFPAHAEAWVPLARDGGEMTLRANRYFSAVGRLKEGQPREAAEAEMKAISAQLEAAHPKDNTNWTVKLTPWREYLVRGGRLALLVLMGAVVFVLLIACANIANLLLARATSRRKEMAIRAALGASRLQLLQQQLVESVMLSIAGGAAGLLLAWWGLKALLNLLPAFEWSYSALTNARDDVRIDGAALAFTVGISVLTGIIFGLIPGWQASRAAFGEWLKEGSRGTEGLRHQRTRSALVVAEIALALVLLAGSGLLIQSFIRMQKVDYGYDPQGLMTMGLTLPRQNRALFARQVQDRIAQTPGVESVSFMSFWTFGGLVFPFNIEDRPFDTGDQNASYSAISPEYFRTLKAGLLAGREFDDRDRPDTPGVAIINETMASQYFGGEDPLGKKVVISYLGARKSREIVGVVSDIKQDEPDKPTRPEIFVPFEQEPWFFAALVVRSASPNPLTVQSAVQQAIWDVNKNLPVSKAETIEQRLDNQVAEPRLYTLLLGIFALVAVGLAAVGIYAVISYTVAQRTHEIGIRMAVGAQPKDVLKLIVGQGLLLTLAGLATGVLSALALTRVMTSLLFEVGANDPTTFIVISLLLAGVALAATYLPARRATKVDPMIALRTE